MKVPNQVLALLDKELTAKLIADNSDEVLLKELLVNTEPKNIKERVEVSLNSLYEQYGYNKFLQSIEHLKTFRDVSVQQLIEAKGEIAEIVLTIMLKEFIKVRGHTDWKVYKGLILGKIGNSTELDIILATSGIVCVLEVKSYSGSKTLTDKCYLSAKHEIDVWNQNMLHIKYFWATFRNCCKVADGSGAIKSALFSFSSGELIDNRDAEWKKLMPVLEVNNLVKFLVSVESIKSVRWDLDALQFSVGLVVQDAPTIEQHIAYLKSKRGGKK